MGSHPINLAVRFILEIVSLAAFGVWGWNQCQGGLRLFFGLGFPVIAVILWGTFAVPGDPSCSGNAPIAIPGVLRLVLELVFFALAVWALLALGFTGPGWALGILVVIHYIVSYDRINWLIKQ